jgi:ribonuclease P/MRP protein subunit POP5
MKPYPPTLKSKKRYVMFEVVSDKKFAKEDVKKAVWSVLHENLGNMGLADAEFSFIDFEEKSQKGILRCTNTKLEQVRAALALLSEINLYKAFLYVRTVTGSIKKANSRVI